MINLQLLDRLIEHYGPDGNGARAVMNWGWDNACVARALCDWGLAEYVEVPAIVATLGCSSNQAVDLFFTPAQYGSRLAVLEAARGLLNDMRIQVDPAPE